MRLDTRDDEVLDDRIALVTSGGEHHRRPERIHSSQMRFPIPRNRAQKNRRKFDIEPNLFIKRIDELANAVFGNMTELRRRRDHIASTTTITPSAVQHRELISMRNRSWWLERPRALQARFPGSSNGLATTSLIEIVLFIGVSLKMSYPLYIRTCRKAIFIILLLGAASPGGEKALASNCLYR